MMRSETCWLVAVAVSLAVAVPAQAQDSITVAPAWGTAQGGPGGNPSRDADAGLEPDVVWQGSVDHQTSQQVLADNGRVFAEDWDISNPSGAVTAYDIVDGNQLWSVDTNNYGAVTGAGVIVIRTFTGIDVRAQATGTMLWSSAAALGDRVLVDDDTVYVVSTTNQSDYVVDALDAQTGTSRWHKTPVVGVANPDTDTGRDPYQPVIVEGKLVLRSVLGHYVALNTTDGSVAWSQTAVGTNPTSAATMGSMAVDDGTVFANDERGGLVALDGATGAVDWLVTGCATGTVAADDDRVYLSGTCGSDDPVPDSQVRDRDTGAAVWSADSAGGVIRAGGRVYWGRAFQGTQSGFGYAFDATVGTLLASYPNLVGRDSRNALQYGPTLVVITDDGLTAYRDITPPLVTLNSPPGQTTSTQPALEWTGTDAGTGVTSYDVLIDGAPVAAGLAPTQTSFAPPAPLADGAHEWAVRAVDAAGNERTTATRGFLVDTQAPDAVSLDAPANTAEAGRAVSFAWFVAADHGGSGVVDYTLMVDGVNAGTVAAGACGSACTAGATGLGPGSHTWSVRAIDGVGLTSDSVTRTFNVGPPPTARLTGPSGLVQTGQPLTFDASASTDAFDQPVTAYAWDLDGDGTFEIPDGPGPTITHVTSAVGAVHPTVRVTDARGRTATAQTSLDVRLAPPAGRVGVTINDGDRFTNDPDVQISTVWPQYVQDLVLANDGGFAAALARPIAPTVPWRLDSDGAERLPKTVYIRFEGGNAGPETYADDIILDQTAPTLRVSSRPGSRRIRIKARDATSGIDALQITSNRRRPGAWKAPRRRVTRIGRRTYVRARDRAGNISRFKRAPR
jgi:hypothetical protein